jgi:hypothetical protein
VDKAPDDHSPVDEMIEATNTENRTRLLGAFANDAVLVDFGRRFVGREEIGSWSDRENIGTHNRLTVTGVSRQGKKVDVAIEVSGDGYNGSGHLRFVLADSLITRLDITD